MKYLYQYMPDWTAEEEQKVCRLKINALLDKRQEMPKKYF